MGNYVKEVEMRYYRRIRRTHRTDNQLNEDILRVVSTERELVTGKRTLQKGNPQCWGRMKRGMLKYVMTPGKLGVKR